MTSLLHVHDLHEQVAHADTMSMPEKASIDLLNLHVGAGHGHHMNPVILIQPCAAAVRMSRPEQRRWCP